MATGGRVVRTTASVMNPKAPSLPIHHARRSGPAAEAGTSRVSTTPRGLTRRRLSTRLSIRPHAVAKCPAARAAIQPPKVDIWNDWGYRRKAMPSARSASSKAGPRIPACARTRPPTGSIHRIRFIRAISTEITPWKPGGTSGSTPPTTEVPPP